MTRQPHSVAIEQLLHQAKKPLSIEQITQAIDCEKTKVRNVIRYLLSTQKVKRCGTTPQTATYRINPKFRCDIGVLTPTQPHKAAPSSSPGKASKPAQQIIYPPGLKPTIYPSPGYQKLQADPAQTPPPRPESAQFLQIPSRTGDQYTPHRPPAAMCVGALADNRNNARD